MKMTRRRFAAALGGGNAGDAVRTIVEQLGLPTRLRDVGVERDHFDAIASGALRLTGATAWTRRNFARWMFEDYPRAMAATPRRWHRGMFTGPGAYRGTTA